MSNPSKPESEKQRSAEATVNPDKICFTIMPFSGWFDEYYKQVYVPAIKSAGLKPLRADELYSPGPIMHDVWELAKKATLVLADLSGRNANVLYELGLAHALAKPAVMVAQTMDDIPFDLRNLRIIVYDRNQPNWGEALKEAIEKTLKETMASPQKSILPSFLQVDDSQRPTVTTSEKEVISLRQDVDLLRREVASLAAATASLIPARGPTTSERILGGLG